MVAGEGFEPSIFGLWARRVKPLLYPAIIIIIFYISNLLNLLIFKLKDLLFK